ncbi:MAG: transcription antitermination factor NusB [Lachnospiraceae bacterium]|nr:transcription antitermination factor NusB [Lachnospiraceae bacterium]
MTRREIREAVFKIVYMSDFYSGSEAEEQAATFLAGIDGMTDDEKKEIEGRADGVIEKKKELDCLIDEKTEGWKASRMPKTDLATIRLALYEIREEGLDAGIAINEAVDIAKKYGDENSGSFVNGVLARLI